MIRSKLLYGLETVELSPALLTKLETFQIKGLRKILHMKPPFIDRRNSNAEVYRRTREACESRYSPASSLVWNIRQCITEKRIKLTGHPLRSGACDPMRQVSFRRNSATPYTPTSPGYVLEQAKRYSFYQRCRSTTRNLKLCAAQVVLKLLLPFKAAVAIIR